MSKLTGAEIVVECLKEQGVDTVFGYPGGAILNIYDALYQHQDEITHILTSHEQGASHAADGYARATGRVGVCLATSGPGATNLVTGIATAYMDSVPVVAITCNVTNSLLGKDSFQEIDITGVTMPITKYNFIVKDVNRLATVIRRAFTIAQTGRPGPVLVDITKDVTAAPCEYEKQVPLHIVFQISIISGHVHDALAGLVRQICPSQVGVQHHPGCIDNPPQALFLLACNAGHNFRHQRFLGPHLTPPAFQDVLSQLINDFPDRVHNHCSGRTFRKKKEPLILQHLVNFRNLSE